VFVYEDGFQPHDHVGTVGVRDGEATVAPGPVVATGNVVAGFFVLDVASADDAAEWTKRIPTATYGKIEVRPIVEFES
jgi:hypothetical protein